MSRPTLATFEVRQPYLSIVYSKIPGEAAWTQLDQGKVVTPNAAAEQKEYRRIGDQNVTKVGGAVTIDVTLQIYVEQNWAEIAHVLGVARPGGGWAGTENIQLDPTKYIDLKIENYDGITTAAVLKSTEYLNRFNPQTLSPALDADGDARLADVSGAAASYYIIPVAST